LRQLTSSVLKAAKLMNIDLFVPCIHDQFYPELAWKALEVLEAAGCKVRYNKDQTCCGRFACENGKLKEASEVTEKLLDDFRNKQAIVSACSDCTHYVTGMAEQFFQGSIRKNMYDKVSSRFFDVADFLVNQLGITHIPSTFKGKLLYIDAPSSDGHLERIRLAHFELLRNIPNAVVRWEKDPGPFQLLDFSAPQRLAGLIATQLEEWFALHDNLRDHIIVSARSNVYMQIQHFLTERKLSHWKLMHPFEILAIND